MLLHYRNDSARGEFGAPNVVHRRAHRSRGLRRGRPSIGYRDFSGGTENFGFVYRTDDADIKVSQEGGFAVGWLGAGEWLAYSVAVDHPGVYAVSARIGSALAGRTFHIEVDGTDVTGAVAVSQSST